jgi:hypothetical protein
LISTQFAYLWTGTILFRFEPDAARKTLTGQDGWGGGGGGVDRPLGFLYDPAATFKNRFPSIGVASRLEAIRPVERGKV